MGILAYEFLSLRAQEKYKPWAPALQSTKVISELKGWNIFKALPPKGAAKVGGGFTSGSIYTQKSEGDKVCDQETS